MQATHQQKYDTHIVSLDTQITQLHEKIRTSPAKVELRVHLAQLLMIAGQWQKCLQQLQTAAQLDNKTSAMAQTYRALIQAEIQREQLFQGIGEPKIIGSIEPWQTMLAEAFVARAQQQSNIADMFQTKAYAEAPTCAFTINNESAEWVADGDSRLGPVCEVFINGNYCWIAFNQIQQIAIEAPQDLRDLVWIPATIRLTDFSQHFGFLPSRYAGSYAQQNDQLSFSSLTEWNQLSEQSWGGLGQKMLVTDQAEYPLLSVRSLAKIASV